MNLLPLLESSLDANDSMPAATGQPLETQEVDGNSNISVEFLPYLGRVRSIPVYCNS